jgi:hypothetical protein
MKKIITMAFIAGLASSSMAQISGTWKCTFIGVGPNKGDVSWYNTNIDGSTRNCLADDEYVFNSDGSFENKLGSETWVEKWQGAATDGCATPVAPHDGSNKGSWRYDAGAGKLSIVGKGNYLGLTKPYNGGELDGIKSAPDSIVYEVAINGSEMTVDINIGTGYWRYTLKKEGGNQTVVTNPTGNWGMHFMGVGPNKGDVSWYNTPLNSSTRPCLADDEYQFSADGTFKNVLGTETWVEGWQGAATDGCAAPVAPFDGSNAGKWMDNGNGTVSIIGKGNYIGLPKVTNTGELTSVNGAKDTLTYEIMLNDAKDTMYVNMNFGSGNWLYVFHKIMPVINTDPKGDWNMTFIGVGPSKGNVSWYNTPLNATTRGCLADDVYSFDASGKFTNVLGTETWVEGWQGAATDGCAAPVAPHDGKTAGTWKDNKDGSVTINGKGNYLGLAKVINGGELKASADAVDGITYEMVVNADTMIADIAIKTGDGTPAYWHFRFLRANPTASNKKMNKLTATVYPNPAHSVLWIANVQDGKPVTISTMDGKVCIRANTATSGIDISALTEGVYLVSIPTENGITVERFIKQ